MIIAVNHNTMILPLLSSLGWLTLGPNLTSSESCRDGNLLSFSEETESLRLETPLMKSRGGGDRRRWRDGRRRNGGRVTKDVSRRTQKNV